MFSNLIETNARRQRSARGAALSLLIHAGVIGLALAATAHADGPPQAPEPDRVAFVEPLAPEAPAPASPAADVAPARDDAPVLPGPAPLALPQAPLVAPDVIPPVDLSRAGISAPEFGRGSVTGAHDHDARGAAPGRDVGTRAWDEVEVERPVVQLPGAGSPRYPSLLASQRVSGRVVAEFVVDTLGRVEDDTFRVIESSHELFAEAVRRALPAMRFRPAQAGGRRVRQLVRQPFVFDLR